MPCGRLVQRNEEIEMTLRVLCRTALLVAASLAFGAGSPADAAQADKPKKQKPRQTLPTGAEDAAPANAAPNADEQAVEQMTSRSSEGLTIRTLPDGAESVDLEGRFMHLSMAVTRSDGSKTVTCTTAPKAAKTAPAPAKAPTVLEEK
jgi:hypothetical protein